MSISENIRALAREGLSTADIARRLDIRYQHAYNVLKTGGVLTSPSSNLLDAIGSSMGTVTSPKPQLTVDELMSGGFGFSSRWILSDEGQIILDHPLPKIAGTYAFAKNGVIFYVGLATMGLAKRLYFYAKPGATQKTSQRLNAIIKAELLVISSIDIYTATPPDFEWNGLPIHGSSGLELGLIKKFRLPWNMRSAG